MLKIPVIVGKVNNLSDARFCAAVGVEMIGYCCNKADDRFVTAEMINAMVGWTAGVDTLLEFGNQPESEILAAIENIKPQAIMLPTESITQAIRQLSIKVIALVTDEKSVINQEFISYSINELPSLKYQSKAYISGDFDNSTILNLISEHKAYGIYLKGGDEIRPGIKTFDELQDIFEVLEVD
jgi:phosphoribosylanthranilate isomerase